MMKEAHEAQVRAEKQLEATQKKTMQEVTPTKDLAQLKPIRVEEEMRVLPGLSFGDILAQRQ